MLNNSKVSLGQLAVASAAGIQTDVCLVDQISCQRAVSDGFHDDSASNVELMMYRMSNTSFSTAPIHTWALSEGLNQLGGCFYGLLGILQGHLHIHFRQFRHEILLYEEDVGLRVLDRIRKNFEVVSLDMMTVLLWVQQLFPNLVE